MRSITESILTLCTPYVLEDSIKAAANRNIELQYCDTFYLMLAAKSRLSGFS